MKKSIHYTIPFFLIIFLINPAFGFAGMTANDSTAQLDLNNITESDQDIVLVQSLIEVDAVQLQSENRLLVRETLIFRNEGEKNFSGNLRTWVPDGAELVGRDENMRIVIANVTSKIEMKMDARRNYINALVNGNIISWQDFVIANNPLPPLYIVEYTLPAKPEGTLTKAIHYSKVFLYPTLTKQPTSIVLKVIRSKEESVTVTDEKGSSISVAGNPKEEETSVLYGWEFPEFKEFNIEISKPAITPAGIAGYVILGLVIVLVISYPLIRTRSEKIQALEEKIRNSLKREETEEVYEEVYEEAAEEAGEETVEEGVTAEAEEEVPPVEEDAELEGKTRDELLNLKTEILSKLGELDKDYESGNLLDEEYDELRTSYQQKVEKITRRLEQPG